MPKLQMPTVRDTFFQARFLMDGVNYADADVTNYFYKWEGYFIQYYGIDFIICVLWMGAGCLSLRGAFSIFVPDGFQHIDV